MTIKSETRAHIELLSKMAENFRGIANEARGEKTRDAYLAKAWGVEGRIAKLVKSIA